MKKYFFCGLLILLNIPAFTVKAQLLQRVAQKIRSYKNISYTDALKFKFEFQEEASNDSIRSQIAVIPAEAKTGGYFSLTLSAARIMYDGNKLLSLYSNDSTYYISDSPEGGGQNTRTVLNWAKNIDEYAKRKHKTKQLTDTLIAGKAYNRIRVSIKDTVEKNDHLYALVDFIIEPKTLMPRSITMRMHDRFDDGSISGFNEQHTYSDWKTDQKNFPDLSVANIPPYYKLPVSKKPLTPIAAGTKAPKLELIDMKGKPFDMDGLSGKVLLFNFTSIGCAHCANAAGMLNNLYNKYKSVGLEIISIYNQQYNKTDAIQKFDARFNIKFPSYTIAKDAEEAYGFRGYPGFFLADRQGNILQYYSGFYAGLEDELDKQIGNVK